MKNNVKTKLKKYLFLFILVNLLLISNGRYTLYLATWISTSMLLYVVRQFPKIRGYLIAWLFLTFAFLFQFYELVPLPTPFYILLMVAVALLLALPYLIDLAFFKHQDNFLHTLIFPTSWVVISYLLYKYNPYGSWLHIGYSQFSHRILVQSVSVFGLGFITFLIGWFASMSNWVFAQKFQWSKIKNGITVYAIVMLIAFSYGSYRLLFQKPQSQTIRIASISAKPENGIYDNDFFGLNLTGGTEKFQKQAAKLNTSLFKRSIQEAKAGAKIVFWAEGNSLILKQDEQELYQKAAIIADENSIYLGIATAIIDQKNAKPIENKFILFDPDGNKTIDYWKVIPVPGTEASMANIKGSKIQKVTTPYGTIAASICFDMDFPDYLKQANDVDILLTPSNDWRAIDPIHTHMASFRAIEQGFNLVRQTSNGLSAGIDYTGKVLSEMDDFTDTGKVLITFLPTKGLRTIYSRIGDVFILFCAVLFIVVIMKLLHSQAEKSY